MRFKFFVLFSMGFLMSCGHYRTSEYVPQGDYSSPAEFMAEPNLTRPTKKMSRGAFQLGWPVKNMTINRGWIESGKKEHHGLDLGGRRNDPILAAHDGFVIYAGSGFKGYGKMVIIEYDSTWATLYGHLNKFKVKTGDEVKAGQQIGFMGRTGRASGVHLHFELIKNKIPIDPMPIFKAQGTVAQY